jgi:hypothetical protein
MRDLSISSPSSTDKVPSSRVSGRQTLAERLQQLVEDRRGHQKAIPLDLGRHLNQLQLVALHSLENFGWHLWFVRRPLFMQPVVVVTNKDSSELAILEDDGSVNMKPSLQLRH